jgi:hypothetical protein
MGGYNGAANLGLQKRFKTGRQNGALDGASTNIKQKSCHDMAMTE